MRRPVAAPTAVPLGYKWVRINMKTNRIAAPYFVDQARRSRNTGYTRLLGWRDRTAFARRRTKSAMPMACSRFICSLPWLWPKARETCCALKWWARRFGRPAPSPWKLAVPPALVPLLQLLPYRALPTPAVIPSTSIDGRPHDVERRSFHRLFPCGRLGYAIHLRAQLLYKWLEQPSHGHCERGQ